MTWLEGVKKDMKYMDLHENENEAFDRKGWKRNIFVDDYMEKSLLVHVGDPTYEIKILID